MHGSGFFLTGWKGYKEPKSCLATHNRAILLFLDTSHTIQFLIFSKTSYTKIEEMWMLKLSSYISIKKHDTVELKWLEQAWDHKR